MGIQYFDDGSSIVTDDATGAVISKDTAGVWTSDPTPAPGGMNVFNSDAQEQARMGAGYPDNGQSWDFNAAMLGVSRLIDTAGRTYASVKGSMAPTYAGQNGQTYSQGQSVQPGGLSSLGGVLPLLVIGGIALAVLR